MPGLVGVVDRAYNSVDHANKIGHHMTYDAPFKTRPFSPTVFIREKGLACEATQPPFVLKVLRRMVNCHVAMAA